MRQPTRSAIFLAFAALYLIWGSTYLFIRLAIDSFPPFLMVASFLWSVWSLYSRAAKNSPSPFLAAAQQMICGGALLLLAGLITRERFQPQALIAHSIWAWIYLVLIGAIIGFGAYIYLLRHCDPTKVATYAYVNLIVAVILGTLFAGGQLTSRTMVAAALIIGSVAIVITAAQLKP